MKQNAAKVASLPKSIYFGTLRRLWTCNSCVYWSTQRKVYICLSYMRSCVNKYVMIIRFHVNDKSVQRWTYCLIGFIINIWLLHQEYHLQINISVQRLNINVVLGILWWALPLYEFIHMIWNLCEHVVLFYFWLIHLLLSYLPTLRNGKRMY